MMVAPTRGRQRCRPVIRSYIGTVANLSPDDCGLGSDKTKVVVAVPVYIYMYGYIFTCTNFCELAFKLDKGENLNIANMPQ